MTDMVEATQADLDAAADFLETWEPGPEMTVVKLAKAFAHHHAAEITRLRSELAAAGRNVYHLQKAMARDIDDIKATARKDALEEAAKVADSFAHGGERYDQCLDCPHRMREDIASAIRALGEK